MKPKLILLALLPILACACTQYSHERIDQLQIKAISGLITSDEINEIIGQADWLLDNAVGRMEAYIGEENKAKKAEMIFTMWDEIHPEDIKTVFAILNTPEVMRKMNARQHGEVEKLKERFKYLTVLVSVM